ncbi:unnamed protein product, partial [Ectocarpus fasciculatus]
MYIFDSELVLYYEAIVEDRKDFILMNIRKLIEKSHANLKGHERENFDLKHSKVVNNILFKTNYAKDYVNDIISYLVRDNIDFYAPNKYETHYRNGVFNLKEFEFKKRDRKIHFISVYIERDFEIPKLKYINAIEKLVSQIIPNKDDKNCILKEFGASITGDVVDDQTNLFLLGKGSTGKSTLMKLLKASLDIYVLELKNNTFTQGNTKIDKILNEFKEKTYLRIAWINEMEDKKLDQSLFKSFCEGLLQSTSLYKDGLNNFKHFCKLIFTANTFPRIIIDGGTVRRIEAYEHQSLFVDALKSVNEEKNIYLKNTALITELEGNDNYKNAFFYIIAKYSHEWLKNKKCYPKTANFDDTKNKVVNINDTIGEFVDEYLIITNNDNDRVSKLGMYELFKHANPKSFIDMTQLMGILNNKDINFSYKKRLEGKQGCYVGVKIKDESDSINEDTDKEKELKDELKKAVKRIKELEEQIKSMKSNKEEDEKIIKELDDIDDDEDIDNDEDIEEWDGETINEEEEIRKEKKKEKKKKEKKKK